MILCHSAFNTLHRLYCNQSGRIVGFDEMTKLNSREFVEAIFAIQSRIQKLMLTQEELCLLGSLAIMLAGNAITFYYFLLMLLSCNNHGCGSQVLGLGFQIRDLRGGKESFLAPVRSIPLLPCDS